MLQKQRFDIDPCILAEAAEWFAVLGSDRVSKTETQQWQAWLTAHPDHRTAWSRVEHFTHKFHILPSEAASAALNTPDLYRRRALKAFTLLGAISFSGWKLWQQGYLQELTSDYHTGIGAIRIITLSDGTQVTLDSNSAFNCEFSAQLRRLYLVSGELYIETAADSWHRPLLIESLQGRVRALGTRFSVRQLPETTQVAVFEDAVEIQPSRLGSAKLTLHTGQSTHFSKDGIAAIKANNADRPAWTQGILVADNLPLSEFLLQLNRYRHGYLTCAPQIADIRIVGSFPLNDTDRILTTLEQTLPVKITTPLPLWVKLLPR